jgi:hypothetical protein
MKYKLAFLAGSPFNSLFENSPASFGTLNQCRKEEEFKTMAAALDRARTLLETPTIRSMQLWQVAAKASKVLLEEHQLAAKLGMKLSPPP